ncbi:L-ascorbate metabolism protein UlaG (beta-lactamase superfamily) [Actinoplanes campanulatus]|uniref:L-ascorbate metabolism protein UlaG (Beta-lactamase superfamily) n=1 Tax=Actinoplanes campanulatus TaxID=113559 RepID=A0A7W5AAJ3_9ACTN|nr:MBL fold metallo-hydrolase [Actinoplanes campanulatus]MBB3092673.1 L-ascorbate metabolism protein UlaG (beta-lactamase superfamily) [Actinoplanes campanulatus]GGM98217.1 membrane protein [Actinoplanes campanulatus]GID34230.1 membrane protein [Actinoplanes campanulatus]
MSTTEVTWWGHSTVWLADSGTTLLTDPVLTGRLAHLRRMAGPSPRLPGAPDAVLLSHLHADHFHVGSLRAVPGKPLLIVPRGAAAFTARVMGAEAGDRCVELAPGETTVVGGVRVRAVPARHDGGRGPWSRDRAIAIGFVVEGAARTWFAGDTGLFDGMHELGPLDLALVPVGGWGPTLGSHGHLDAADGAEALRRVRASWAVPVHYGTLWPIGMGRIRRHMFDGPGERFAEHAARVAPESRVRVLAHGESLSLEPAA